MLALKFGRPNYATVHIWTRTEVMTALGMTAEDRAASIVIEAQRENRGMPKAELARRAGISLRTVNYYLNGERAMTLGAFRTLHTILGLSREEAADRIARVIATFENSEH